MPVNALAQISATRGDELYALAVAVVIAVIYLIVLRLIDLNEKEPIWALVLATQQGFIAAILLPLFLTPAIELSNVWEPLLVEVAKFVGIVVITAVLVAVGRARGWAEIGGVMDGLIYGAAVGLGFAVGDTLYREVAFGGRATAITAGAFGTIWGTALVGLAEGLFGAIAGAGIGAAVRARTSGLAVGYAALGLVGAVATHILYQLLRTSGAVGGSTFRTWVALAIPVVSIVVLVALSLSGERRAIREHLQSERETGAVRDEEFALLTRFSARQGAYASAFFRGDFDYWLSLRSLHNRLVQLALAKAQVEGEDEPARRAVLDAEIERLRASTAELRVVAEARKGRSSGRTAT
jgi:protease PrsW